MKSNIKIYLPLFVLLLSIFTSCKKNNYSEPGLGQNTNQTIDTSFEVASVLQSGMVIQRDKPIKIWGNAKSNTSVKVAVTCTNDSFITKVTSSGFWEIVIPPTSLNVNP